MYAFPDAHDEDVFIEDAAADLRRKLDGRRATRTQRVEAWKEETVVPPVTDPRYAGVAEILALEASEDPEVVLWRATHLPMGEPVDDAHLKETVNALGKRPSRGVPRRRFGYVHGSQARSFPVDARSALGELGAIAARLARGYHWTDDEAATFVLTGRPPRVAPVVARVRATQRAATSRITLSVDPRISPTELGKIYGDLRRLPLLEAIVGHRASRPLDERSVSLAVFVARHHDESWARMRQRWNAEHPEWPFNNDRAFWTDARRAWQRVVGAQFSKEERARRRGLMRVSAKLGVAPDVLDSLPNA